MGSVRKKRQLKSQIPKQLKLLVLMRKLNSQFRVQQSKKTRTCNMKNQ